MSIDEDGTPMVSVVIPARNAAATIGEQLAALARQEDAPPFEVVVVDNASSDGTGDIVAGWADRIESLRVVTCEAPGLNRARNAGVRAAISERIVICDADDVASPQWVAAMSKALETFDIVAGCLDAELLNDDFVRQTRDLPPPGELPGPYWGLPYAVGANIGFRRSVFERVGGFDPELHGAEEIDFCWRAQAAGCTLGASATAVMSYRLRTRLRDAARQSFAYGRGNAQLRAAHIRLGTLPLQTRRQQASLVKKYVLTLAHIGRLRGRVSRRRYLQDVAWFAGSLAGLVRYGAIT
jgi:glycosyltransferase involved in cell wall biosynthesis